jgi:hypothetical protein
MNGRDSIFYRQKQRAKQAIRDGMTGRLQKRRPMKPAGVSMRGDNAITPAQNPAGSTNPDIR